MRDENKSKKEKTGFDNKASKKRTSPSKRTGTSDKVTTRRPPPSRAKSSDSPSSERPSSSRTKASDRSSPERTTRTKRTGDSDRPSTRGRSSSRSESSVGTTHRKSAQLRKPGSAPKTSYKQPSPGRRVRKERTSGNSSDLMRLNRFLAHAGLCSRREADEYISSGVVSVNGKVVTELGTKVLPTDVVKFSGEELKNEQKVYILMNKPKDYITTVRDPHATKTVMDLIGKACKERIYPVGRLDRNTTGVLLLTNDGDLVDKLTHPSYNKKKIYHVTLDKALKGKDMMQFAEGVMLDDGLIAVDKMNYVDATDKKQVGVEIHSGRNRIVRRMFEVLGYKVIRLDRVYFAGLTKKNVPRGKWRFLTEMEVSMLKRGSYE